MKNMNITFEKVEKNGDITALAALANQIWHEYFPCILTEAQIDYMVEKFQSAPAMEQQIASAGYEYYFICKDGVRVGYTGFVREEEKMFLSKLYLKKEYRGQGIASRVFEFLEQECRRSGLHAIYLTVNRHNDNTIAVYEKKGFHTVKEQAADIGCGYVMDDYVMECGVD